MLGACRLSGLQLCIGAFLSLRLQVMQEGRGRFGTGGFGKANRAIANITAIVLNSANRRESGDHKSHARTATANSNRTAKLPKLGMKIVKLKGVR
jgi:hypothetical protein